MAESLRLHQGSISPEETEGRSPCIDLATLEGRRKAHAIRRTLSRTTSSRPTSLGAEVPPRVRTSQWPHNHTGLPGGVCFWTSSFLEDRSVRLHFNYIAFASLRAGTPRGISLGQTSTRPFIHEHRSRHLQARLPGFWRRGGTLTSRVVTKPDFVLPLSNTRSERRHAPCTPPSPQSRAVGEDLGCGHWTGLYMMYYPSKVLLGRARLQAAGGPPATPVPTTKTKTNRT